MPSDPTVKPAGDLREILRLYGELSVRAVDLATSSLMPGGEAMVELAPTANLDVWDGRQSLDEDRGIGTKRDHAADADPDQHWTAYQTLRFWSEAWRSERGAEHIDTDASFVSEVKFLLGSLTWAWENEIHFEDFEKDVRRAKAKLENVLRAGIRPAFVGIPCPDPDCKGKRLVRWTGRIEYNGARPDYARLKDWECPSCGYTWDDDAYARAEVIYRQSTGRDVHFLNLDGEVWVSMTKAREMTGHTAHRIWNWITRGAVRHRDVAKAGTYVHMGELRERDALRAERARRMTRL